MKIILSTDREKKTKQNKQMKQSQTAPALSSLAPKI